MFSVGRPCFSQAGRITMPRTPDDFKISFSNLGSQANPRCGFERALSPAGTGPVSPRIAVLLVTMSGLPEPSSDCLSREGRSRATRVLVRRKVEYDGQSLTT